MNNIFIKMENKTFHFLKTNPITIIKEYNEKKPEYYVYTDGACSNNGKSNAKAGYGIYFGENDNRNTYKRIEGKQTNNTAEITAIIEAYYLIEDDIKNGINIGIVTDSTYSINCIKNYGKKCNQKNWNVEIPNKELVKIAFELFNDKQNISFIHINSHTNKKDIHSFGNSKADELANKSIGHFSSNKKIYLDVPYEKKNEAKIMGAKWDINKKKWYIMNDCKNKTDFDLFF